MATVVVSATLVAGSLMTVAEGIGYLSVGYLLRRRHVSEDARLAVALFALWWYAIGTNKAVAGIVGLGVAFDQVTLELYVAVLHFNLAILCLSLTSLLYYFVYLFWGRKDAIYPIAAFYLGFFILLTYNLISVQPVAIQLRNWRIDHVSATETPPALGLAIVLLLVVPQVLGALSHFLLYFRTTDAAQRRRIALVSWSIVAWTVSVVLILTPTFDRSALLQLLSRIIGMAGAVAGLLAYRNGREPVVAQAERAQPG